MLFQIMINLCLSLCLCAHVPQPCPREEGLAALHAAADILSRNRRNQQQQQHPADADADPSSRTRHGTDAATASAGGTATATAQAPPVLSKASLMRAVQALQQRIEKAKEAAGGDVDELGAQETALEQEVRAPTGGGRAGGAGGERRSLWVGVGRGSTCRFVALPAG